MGVFFAENTNLNMKFKNINIFMNLLIRDFIFYSIFF